MTIIIVDAILAPGFDTSFQSVPMVAHKADNANVDANEHTIYNPAIISIKTCGNASSNEEKNT